MKAKKVLVTGGSGFLGSHVADELQASGYDVCLVDNKKSKYKTKNQKEFIGSILSFDDLDNAVKGCSLIYHFAAQADIGSSSGSPTDTIKSNIIGTQNALEAAIKNNVNRFIFLVKI